ncbi:MAG: hypothetical protein CVU10_05040 [Bacteroidetes bacterium HGW-Bacteroidetes-5]|jgi:hypothetical protein|nr:MAG: hypothetical protein CVU10_05040 [Bacteroidetes bacterium HGW-Bacteroidetes-5]
MKKVIKYIFLALILIGSLSEMEGRSRIIPAKGKYASRFLIVIDRESFDAASKEVAEYKKVLEHQGLGVEILIGEWSSPETLREEIRKIYKKRSVMEGALFVGDIPVVRVRNFQHATTAFKMDEDNFPITESSVTSDRYYDDLDLEFVFFKIDSLNPRHFYYNLKESSPQRIESEFYSARVLPPSDFGVEPYELIRRFFKKAVEAHLEQNYADNIIFFNGHGYNSDCLTVWQNQQFAIKEQFPAAFLSSKGNAFYNFRQDPFMKFKLYERMQRKGTDLFVFHEHGAFDTQYISGEYPAPNTLTGKVSGPMEAMSVSIRNTYRRYAGKRKSDFKSSMMADFGITESFFDQEVLRSTKAADSTFAANINISLEDLKTITPQSRITIFDACYNGSFHQKGYVAGYHVFADGNTVVAQGNTVNVLQDKWSMELIGMLAEGARVGFWQKEIQTLESHLIGDPTYRLIPGTQPKTSAEQSKVSAEESAKNRQRGDLLNRDLATRSKDNRYWMSIFEKNADNPNYLSIALKQLAKNPPPGYSDLLLKVLRESPYSTVRMQALKRVIDLADKNLTEALLVGLEDPYELIRRNAARFSGYCGDPKLISPLVNTLLFSNESIRVQYAAQSSLLMFEKELLLSEVKRQSEGSALQNQAKTVSEISEFFNKEFKRQEAGLKTIFDKSAANDQRISAIRSLRNYNNRKPLSQLLAVLSDTSDDLKVRITLAEALGWYNWSINKSEIIGALEALYNDKTTDGYLKSEALQSILRLK